jgi:sugar lactone lactonase YvrE
MAQRYSAIVIIVFALFSGTRSNSAPAFQWALRMDSGEHISSVASDKNGNCYVALERPNLIPRGPSLITKFDGDGKLVWKIPLDPNGSQEQPKLAIDFAGDLVLAAFFRQPDPGQVGTETGLMLAKWSAAGQPLWAKKFFATPLTGGAYPGGVAGDPQGNIYVTGIFRESLNFGTKLLVGGDVNHANTLFVTSFTTGGVLQWANSSTQNSGLLGDVRGEAVCVNGSGDCFVAGTYEGQMILGTKNLPATGLVEGFAAKFNKTGTLQWLAGSTGTGSDYASGVVGLDDGSCWVVGNNQGGSGGYLAKTTGGSFQTDSSARINNYLCSDLTLDRNGRLITAETTAAINLDPPFNVRISAFSTNRTLVWSQAPTSPVGSLRAEKLAVNIKGDIFVAGSLSRFASALFGSIVVNGNPESEEESSFLTKLREEPPTIVSQPRPLFSELGMRADLSVGVAGESPLNYLWFKDGSPLQSEIQSNLVRTAVQCNDAGIYWVVVSNIYGNVESDHVSLTLISHPAVQVTTLAGSGTSGYLDSENPDAAVFSAPNGVTINPDGVIFVADSGNNLVRFIAPPRWEVGTLAGNVAGGYLEAFGTNALFKAPSGLAIDLVGDLLLTEFSGNRLRKILRGYEATMLLAGNGADGFTNGLARTAQLSKPSGLVQNANGSIYFSEFGNNTVRRLGRRGFVSLIAGNPTAGYQDGQGTNALFRGPAGITMYNGDFYVTDSSNHCVRKVTATGLVTTVAGSRAPGFKSGLGTLAELNNPNGICADGFGNLYFTEIGNHSIRRIDTNGWVSAIAGGAQGFADGDQTTAKFSNPGGICFHPDGSLILADTGNNRLRRIVLDGKTNGWTHTGGFLSADLNPTVKVYGAIGERYRIEARDRLGQGDWAAVATITIEHSPTHWVDDRKDGPGQRVYRAVKE